MNVSLKRISINTGLALNRCLGASSANTLKAFSGASLSGMRHKPDTLLFCAAGIEQNCAVSITAYKFTVTNRASDVCAGRQSGPGYTNVENSHTLLFSSRTWWYSGASTSASRESGHGHDSSRFRRSSLTAARCSTQCCHYDSPMSNHAVALLEGIRAECINLHSAFLSSH